MCDSCTNRAEERVHCLDCGCLTGAADFEDVDDEFDPRQPLCPSCQADRRIRRHRCEICGAQAEYETDAGFLCCDHHSDYVDGYRRDD